MTRCRRCNGTYLDDGDGARCILCSRPRVEAPTLHLRLIQDEMVDMAHVIEREMARIANDRAAGRRIWS